MKFMTVGEPKGTCAFSCSGKFYRVKAARTPGDSQGETVSWHQEAGSHPQPAEIVARCHCRGEGRKSTGGSRGDPSLPFTRALEAKQDLAFDKKHYNIVK